MAGLTSIPARQDFAESLLEQLHNAEAEAVKPHKCLDAGVTGYMFDLVPIHLTLGSNLLLLSCRILPPLPRI